MRRNASFRFRISTLLWAMVVVAAFFAGRYIEFGTGSATPQNLRPGRPVEIAIAGPIDIDNDGIDDVDAIRRLASRHGLQVIAYEDSAGNSVGLISTNTSFVVVSDKFDPTVESSRFVTEARRNGVAQVTAKYLLEKLGRAELMTEIKSDRKALLPPPGDGGRL